LSPLITPAPIRLKINFRVKMLVKSTLAVALLASAVAAQVSNITVDPSTINETTRGENPVYICSFAP
jgi:hypothetical protein